MESEGKFVCFTCSLYAPEVVVNTRFLIGSCTIYDGGNNNNINNNNKTTRAPVNIKHNNI